jgi:hypothetical protein
MRPVAGCFAFLSILDSWSKIDEVRLCLAWIKVAAKIHHQALHQIFMLRGRKISDLEGTIALFVPI